MGDLDELASAARQSSTRRYRARPPRPGNSGKFAVVVAIVVGLILVVILARAIGTGGGNLPTGAGPSPAAAQERVYDVDAQKLIALYHENEVEADAMKGKLLDLHGVVSKIRKDAFGRPLVELYGVDRYGLATVNCYFPQGEETDRLSALRSGQKVVIRGRCKGMILNDVVIDGCSFP